MGDLLHAAEPRVDILGVNVSATNPPEALSTIGRWIESDAREYVCVTDVNSLLHASEDKELRAFYNASGLTLPDGVPLVWLGHRAGFESMARVCGPDLMPQLMELSVKNGWSHYLFGGAEGVADRVAARMSDRFPGLKIAGTYCPPFRVLSEAEKAEVVERLNNSGADIIWIGLGAPKQERWMQEYRPLLSAPVLIGVGAAFNFHSGDVKRAPKVLQLTGMEWAFRLSQEPKRLWRRYVYGIPRFAYSVLRRPPRSV